MRVKARPATTEEWRTAVAACPWATFFQDPDWYAQAASLLPDHQVVAEHLEVDGREVVFPLFERRRRSGILGKAVDRRGNARGVYGGWVGREPLDGAQARAVLSHSMAKAKVFRLRLGPLLPAYALDGLGVAVERETTSVLDLAPGAEAVLRGYSEGQQDNLKAARKAGVTSRVATTREDWEAHVRMYRELLARWQGSTTEPYSDAFLVGLSALAPDRCRLWLAERDGQPHAGVIAFYQGRHVALWHASSTEAQRKFYAYKLLMHHVLEDAAARGFRWYDLMPSNRLEGTSAWKRFLHTQSLPAPVLRRPAREARGPRQALEVQEVGAAGGVGAVREARDA